MHFDTLADTWYSSEPFHCGEVEPRAVSYLDIYKKVGGRRVGCRLGRHELGTHGCLSRVCRASLLQGEVKHVVLHSTQCWSHTLPCCSMLRCHRSQHAAAVRHGYMAGSAHITAAEAAPEPWLRPCCCRWP